MALRLTKVKEITKSLFGRMKRNCHASSRPDDENSEPEEAKIRVVAMDALYSKRHIYNFERKDYWNSIRNSHLQPNSLPEYFVSNTGRFDCLNVAEDMSKRYKH